MLLMDYQDLYESILRDLERDIRPQIRLSKNDVSELFLYWTNLLSNWHKEKEPELKKILCIVDHCQTLSREFSGPIVQTLNLELPNDLIIYTIASAQKHIITKSALEGVPIPQDFIEVLKKLLDSKDPEIFEWVLRAIESMGNQSLKFREVVLKKKPSFFATFNKHMKSAKGIIQILEKRWEVFK
jgi:hypothetical protein